MVVSADPTLRPSRAWTCQTSTSTRLRPFGIRRSASHQFTRSNQRTGSAPINHSLPPRTTAWGRPSRAVWYHHVLHARHTRAGLRQFRVSDGP